MKVLSWNCRGMGSPSAVLQCKKKAQDSRPDIMFLMETRLDKDKGKQLLEKCGFMEGWEVPRKGLSGGLLLGWMSPHKLNVLYSTNHLIHANLLDNRGNPLSISFIYGHPTQSKRHIVWSDLIAISRIAHKN